ncbi:uncharacterized protein LOC126792167 [Argentina anserina]|uniref:uncharacterized protein LOC126792167 n=1 Tax=Argentina anserina TaxID=57926 RepID=UPI0021766E12|nr:uncharacterized protein LOC126792167 [Potentilla anserina]
MASQAARSFNGNIKKAVAGLRRVKLDGLRWRVFDAKSQVLGRLASQISTVIQGKDKPTYAPNRDDGDICIVLNAKDICVTGRKLTDKVYHWHTGYVGHLKERTLKDQMVKDPTEVIRKAVLRMLPKNKLRDDRDQKLRIFPGSEHPFGDRPLEPYVMPPRKVREMRPRTRRAIVRAQKKAEKQQKDDNGPQKARKNGARELIATNYSRLFGLMKVVGEYPLKTALNQDFCRVVSSAFPIPMLDSSLRPHRLEKVLFST